MSANKSSKGNGNESSAAAEKLPVLAALSKKDFESDQDVRWCPGCGDYAILATVQRTLPALGVKKEDSVFVSGIGCSSRFPYYMNTYGFHSIHGRAPAIATGLKITRPELSVWVVTGDGDGLSIGGNHLLHALRRNVDLNILLFNNQIYGLTKGQYSPTSKVGTKAASTPLGSIDHPVNPLAFALGASASFIARAADTDAALFASMVTRQYEHKGGAIIEILQNCPVFNDGTWGAVVDRKTRADHQLLLEHGKPLLFGKNNDKGIRMSGYFEPQVVEVGDGDGKVPLNEIIIHDEQGPPGYAFMLASMEPPRFPMPVGVFRAVERPSYEDLVSAQIETAIETRGKGNLKKLLYSGMTWEVGVDGIRH